MEKVLDCIKNIIVYTTLSLVTPPTMAIISKSSRLSCNDKINLAKYFFGNSEVAYLGLICLVFRWISPASVNALTPTNPQVLLLQNKDQDLAILKEHRLNGSWPSDLQPDHRQRLELLDHNLLIDHDNVVWVQCQPECHKAPPRTALYIPVKYHAPVLCQFWQCNPDIMVTLQVAKLQENYCWIGMKTDLLNHHTTCINCAQLTAHK